MNEDIKIVQGEAVDVMGQMADASVDLIIADPPYNLGKDYGNNHDQMGFDAYLSFTRAWLGQAHRILREDGTLYVFMGVRFVSYLYDILDRELEMHFNSWICWHYTQGLGRKKGFSPRHDDILMFTKSSRFQFHLDAVRVPQKYYRARNNMRGANPGDVWQFSHVHYCNTNRQPHPTQKPEGLMARMVLASSQKGNLVVDPFVGSGTSARVCQQLGRRCIGIEMNPSFVAACHERLSAPFAGFDSIDERMRRIPNDLNDAAVRDKYLKNHSRWFLAHHNDALAQFENDVTDKYGDSVDSVDSGNFGNFSDVKK
ncbi:MAG: site-specific DNA-methyltransferase [Deltaproteobacteria bacterium]|nr:site-specific DNA-methyltransferase [Deltaproteobacteria bacterium]